MPPIKKSAASKLLSDDLDDFLTDSEVSKSLPKSKKQIKRKGIAMADIPNVSDSNLTCAKKNKVNESIDACGQSRQKTLNVMTRQLDTRKVINDKMLANLSEIIEDFEADYNILKENKQKLEQFTASALKCIEQSTTAYKLKIKKFKQLHDVFNKRYEEIELEQRSEINKLGGELEEDVHNLKQKLIAETKRTEWENLQKYFMQAMQNNF